MRGSSGKYNMPDERTHVDALQKPVNAERVSGIPGSLFLLSVLAEVVDMNNIRNPIRFGRYANTYYARENRADEWIDAKVFEAESLRLLALIEKEGPERLEKIARDVSSEGDAFKTTVLQRTENMSAMTDTEILATYESLMRDYIHCYGLGAITFIYESTLSELLSASLAKQFENVAEVTEALLATGHSSFMLESERRLQMIADAPEARRDALIGEYQREFYFMNASYNGAPTMTREAVLEKVKGLRFATERAEREKSLKDVDVSKLGSRDATIVQILTITERIRDVRKRTNLIGDYAMSRFMDETMRRTGITADEAKRMTWYELPVAYSDIQALRAHISKRETFTMLVDGGKKYYSEGVWIDSGTAIDTEMKTIRGTPASRGVIKGSVRIVLGPEFFPTFKDGEILVTEMTRPDFVPIMKRAGAILTDEGGLTCHAAIVSRELRIPCIVGIKIGTRVLKDGDMVEVDADKGVVRKL